MSWGKIHHLSLLYDLIVIQKLLLNLESFQNRFCQSIKMHKCMCKRCLTLGKYNLRFVYRYAINVGCTDAKYIPE